MGPARRGLEMLARVSLPRWRTASRIGAYILLAAGAASADEAELRRQIEAQNQLIQQQAEHMQGLEDRLRAIEEERAAEARPGPSESALEAVAASPRALEHVPNTGHAVGESPWGSLGLRLYTCVRYLNQT